MQYGNVHHYEMQSIQSPTIEVGMGATQLLWSDRYPYTVTKIMGKNKIQVQEDIYTMQPDGSYEIKPNPDGEVKILFKTSKGWKVLGGTGYFRVGVRDVYIDPSF